MTDENPPEQQTQRRGVLGWKSRRAEGGPGRNRAGTSDISNKERGKSDGG